MINRLLLIPCFILNFWLQLCGQEPVSVSVPANPQPVKIGGERYLVYELQLVNRANEPVCIQKLEVFDDAGTDPLATLNEEQLRQHFWQQGFKATSDQQAVVLQPDSLGVVYLEVALAGRATPPGLRHKLTLNQCGPGSGTFVLAQSVEVDASGRVVLLGAPLAGGAWAAVHNNAWERGHRRVVYTREGVPRIPGRFAIDFIKLDAAGRYAFADENEIKNWFGYGADVLAVADGVVATTRDDFSESPTLSAHPAYAADLATGNYISLKIADGRYVFYEHLQPGSIQVAPGQVVKKGDVIARLGFTGQTTGPHLHLHVADADSPLGAEGQPFAFENFSLAGYYPDFSSFGQLPWTPAGGPGERLVKNERPEPCSVVVFK